MAWRSRASAGGAAWSAAAELALLFAWVLLIGRGVLTSDPQRVPAGVEFAWATAGYHTWERALQCGWCAVWDGGALGGAPAFADVYSTPLHPLVAASVLALGVGGGAKLIVLGTLFLSGLAQWWLGRALGVGRVARVWAACVAAGAGSVVGRLEHGTLALALSTASCALLLPALVALFRRPTARAAVLMAVTLALAALAGQGYLQLGVVLLSPAALLLLGWPPDARRGALVAERVAQAALLAALLAAPFLLPLARFFEQFVKDTDPAFSSAMPLAFLPLTLVVDSPAFYRSGRYGMQPYPYLYTNFIGWVPLLLAALGLLAGPRERRPERAMFGLAAALALWLAGADPLRQAVAAAPDSLAAVYLAGIRQPSVLAGLAVPLLLGLAALGLDAALRRLSALAGRRRSARWLLVAPLVLALAQVARFAGLWAVTAPVQPDAWRLAEALRTPALAWVSPPYGEGPAMYAALSAGLKLGDALRPWGWAGRGEPPPSARAALRGTPPRDARRVAVVGAGEDAVGVYELPAPAYALLVHPNGTRSACRASGAGGTIDVVCPPGPGGALIVRENAWDGWRAWVGGQPAALAEGRWLELALPAGQTDVALRYLPWDVPLGLGLSALGALLCAALWRATPAAPAAPAPARS